MADTDIPAQIIQDASSVTWFGHTFNVYAAFAILTYGLILWGLWRAHRHNKIDWMDMITGINQSTGQREASTTKIMQVVGAITGTFIVIKTAITGTLNAEIFLIYLAYVASCDSFTRFLLARYGVNTNPGPLGPPATNPGVLPTPPTPVAGSQRTPDC